MDDVKFSKNSFYGRNRIKTNNEVITWLTVPVAKGSTEQKIKDVKISGNEWQKKHWMKIQAGYSKSPFFCEHKSFFEDMYSKNWVYLAELNRHILDQMVLWFGLKTKIERASDYEFEGEKSDRLLSYCKKFGADHYIFGNHGRDYCDQNLFNNNGVSVSFQNYAHPTYPQRFGGFVPCLSFIDCLFNCGISHGV